MIGILLIVIGSIATMTNPAGGFMVVLLGAGLLCIGV